MASKVTKSFIWSFLEQGGSKAITLVVQIVLARLLDPEAFGLLALLLVVINLADSIAQSGLGSALVQKKDSDGDSFSTAFWMSCAISVVLYVLIFFSAPLMASVYGLDDLTPTLRVLGIVVIFNSTNSIQRSYLQREMNFKAICVASVSAIVVSGIVGIAAAIAGFGIWALVIQVIVQNVATCVAMLIIIPWKPTLTFKKQEAGELFSYGWKICVSNLLGTLYESVADLVIGKACNAEALGYYSQGKKWPHTAVAVASNALNNVFFPAFAAMQDDMERLRRNFKRALKLGSFVAMPAVFLLALTAEPLIAILLSEKWLPSVLVFQLICLGDCFMIVRIVNLRAYMALGYSDVYLKLQTIKVLIGTSVICAAAVLTADINIIALVRACFSILTVWFVDLVPASKTIGYSRKQQLLDIMPYLVLSLVAAAIAAVPLLFGLPYGILLCLQIVLFCVAYIGGAKLFKMDVLDEATKQIKGLFAKGKSNE